MMASPLMTSTASAASWAISARLASRISDHTAFFTMGPDRAGYLVEMDETVQIFTNPKQQLTEDYVSGRFG